MSSRLSANGCQASPSSAQRRTAGPDTVPGEPPTQIGGGGRRGGRGGEGGPAEAVYGALYSGKSLAPAPLIARGEMCLTRPRAPHGRRRGTHPAPRPPP